MKKVLAVICLSFTLSVAVMAQQEANAEMQAWMEAIKPGPMHEMLSKMVGRWKTVTTMTDQASGQTFQSEGTATFEAILGGRYIKSSHTGSMMGMPFEGMGIDAYDNLAKEFVSIWIDNFGTGIMVMKGKYDEASKTFTFRGESIDPMTGQLIKYRSVSKWVDDNTTRFEMYGELSGKEEKMFEMVYTRL